MRVSISFTNRNPNTIYNKLSARLGRPATDAEAIAEVKRLMGQWTIERAAQGKLPHQKRGA